MGETKKDGETDPQAPPTEEKRIVSFSTQMTPSAKFELFDPAVRTSREIDPLTPQELQRGTKGGIVLMKIMTMSMEERKEQASTQVGDPIFMWFSFLTPEERRQFLKSAEKYLSETLME